MFYCFEGIKPDLKQNRILHITSDNFDEPRALAIVRSAEKVVTIHGAKGNEKAIYAGGLDIDLKEKVLISLIGAGFAAIHDPSPSRQGKGLTNICNRGSSGKGLQLELTFGLRKAMFCPPDAQGIRDPNQLFQGFVAAVRAVLADYI
jgi:phage replication-related protein YjqB (UPF0714/DUF867 family)